MQVTVQTRAAEIGQEIELAELRARVMKESLEQAGRFDEKRVRARLLYGYQAHQTRVIYMDDRVVGFYVVETRVDCFYLSHLYIDLEYQNKGFGNIVIKQIKSEFSSLPIRLNALKESRANRFYQKHGFSVIQEDDLDTYYEYTCLQANG